MTYYRPLTPELRSKIFDGVDQQIAEMETCQRNVYVNARINGLRMFKNMIKKLPDGYPMPFNKE